MKEILIKDILKITKGKLIIGKEDKICKNFSKDTRTIKNGDVYIGIKGENFDGNNLWEKALEAGADVVIIAGIKIEKEKLEQYNNKTIIKVKDTIIALGQIAKYKREMYDIPIIAITGSVGKTSTKDIIANVIAQKYKTLKTEGNLNNHIGLPFTLLNLDDHEVAVIEMGMNHLGEISYLSNIAKPTISIINNIGTSHIGNLGSRENILKAKLEILEGMKEKKIIINNDNDMLNKLYEYNLKNKSKIEIHTFGIENKSEITATKINLQENYSDFICKINNKEIKIHVPIGGEHFVYNALCAISVGKILGITDEQIEKGIQTFQLTKKRMDIEILQKEIKIINDSYNASFESMQAAIKYLSSIKQERKIAILGDMFELGKFTKELHEKIGEEVAKSNIEILMCLGKEAKNIVQGAKNGKMNKKNIYYFEDRKELLKTIKKEIKPKDVILFKASNGMKFFEIVEEFKKEVLM